MSLLCRRHIITTNNRHSSSTLTGRCIACFDSVTGIAIVTGLGSASHAILTEEVALRAQVSVITRL